MQLAHLFRRVHGSFSRRRVHERARAAVAVDWHVFGGTVHRVSTTADLSCGGAFVHTAEPKARDTPLVLELATERGRVEVHARVVWSGARGMGVRFTRALDQRPVDASD